MKKLQYSLNESLVGKILIASPAMIDNRFYKCLILITSHDENGTTGIIFNKSSAHQFSHILKKIKPDIADEYKDLEDQSVSVVLGGPINSSNIFVLHSNDYKQQNSMKVTKDIYITNNNLIILDIAKNKGPKHSIISFGFCTWLPSQLENEFNSDSWFLAESSDDIVFKTPIYRSYNLLFKKLGLIQENGALFINNHIRI